MIAWQGKVESMRRTNVFASLLPFPLPFPALLILGRLRRRYRSARKLVAGKTRRPLETADVPRLPTRRDTCSKPRLGAHRPETSRRERKHARRSLSSLSSGKIARIGNVQSCFSRLYTRTGSTARLVCVSHWLERLPSVKRVKKVTRVIARRRVERERERERSRTFAES